MRIHPLSRRKLLAGILAPHGKPAWPATSASAVNVTAGRCLVCVMLDGHPARMVLDTGAARSVITRDAATRLGLAFDPWVETTMQGAGGRLETHRNADVRRALWGATALFQNMTQQGLSLAVTQTDLGGADGLLGGDVLRHFTLDLDMPRRSLALRPADWRPPATGAIALTPLWPDRLLAPIRLGHCDLTALLDTGATASLINSRGLQRLALTPAEMQHDPTAAMMAMGGRLPVRLHRFGAFQLGPLRLPEISMFAAFVPQPAFDLILGLDVLGQRHFALSYAYAELAISG